MQAPRNEQAMELLFFFKIHKHYISGKIIMHHQDMLH
jgi:hypothetical protein